MAEEKDKRERREGEREILGRTGKKGPEPFFNPVQRAPVSWPPGCLPT